MGSELDKLVGTILVASTVVVFLMVANAVRGDWRGVALGALVAGGLTLVLAFLPFIRDR